ncbi:MAG: hypothetical protein LBV29_05000 [Azoarcus sp.]|jgi:hypothetical protein|nr:hypothetical protein [Azoarcus sp.]
MTTPVPIPILPYDEHISKAMKLIEDLGKAGIEKLEEAMSVLLYRLSKLLCAAEAPTANVTDLLSQDLEACLNKFPDLKVDEASLRQALSLLEQVLRYAGWYAVDRVLMRTRVEFTDTIVAHQNRTRSQGKKIYSSWGRPLPFRPLFCALGTFAWAFPVLPGMTKYEALPNEDSILYDGGDDKPQPQGKVNYQRSFATLLDACDYQLGHWKAHFKSEPSFDAGGNPLMSDPPHRPKRKGNCYWRKDGGSISPDIVIVKSRNQPPTLKNVTHVVDMKFGSDGLSFKQSQTYPNMFGADNFYVLYFPEDCNAGEPEERTKPQPDWVKRLIAILILLLTKRLGPGRMPVPVPAG